MRLKPNYTTNLEYNLSQNGPSLNYYKIYRWLGTELIRSGKVWNNTENKIWLEIPKNTKGLWMCLEILKKNWGRESWRALMAPAQKIKENKTAVLNAKKMSKISRAKLTRKIWRKWRRSWERWVRNSSLIKLSGTAINTTICCTEWWSANLWPWWPSPPQKTPQSTKNKPFSTNSWEPPHN